MTVTLSNPKFIPERSDYMPSSFPLAPPTSPLSPTAAAHHHRHHEKKMSFVIPASISEALKPSFPRPVLVGDIHPPNQDNGTGLALLPRPSSQPSQPSMSDAPSGAWHQVVSPKKPVPVSYKESPSSKKYYNAGTAGEVYDPIQACGYLDGGGGGGGNLPRAPPVAAAVPVPWRYVNMPAPDSRNTGEVKPGSKGWYE